MREINHIRKFWDNCGFEEKFFRTVEWLSKSNQYVEEPNVEELKFVDIKNIHDFYYEQNDDLYYEQQYHVWIKYRYIGIATYTDDSKFGEGFLIRKTKTNGEEHTVFMVVDSWCIL